MTEVVDPRAAAAMLTDVARWAADLLAGDRRAAAVLDDLDRPVAVDPADCVATYRLELLRIAARDLIGVDTLMWASDYPHGDSTWPRSQEVIAENFRGIPEDERRKMLRDNMIRVYGL